MRTLSFLLLLFFVSCQSGSTKQGSESPQDCWQLNSNDQLRKLDQTTLESYKPFSKIYQHSVRLLRAIDCQAYDVYIGVSEEMPTAELVNAQLKDNKESIIGVRKNTGQSGRRYHDFFIHAEEYFIFRSIYKKSSPELTMVVNVVSQDSSRMRAYFNAASFIDKKLSCN